MMNGIAKQLRDASDKFAFALEHPFLHRIISDPQAVSAWLAEASSFLRTDRDRVGLELGTAYVTRGYAGLTC